jgi:hypothetical protein
MNPHPRRRLSYANVMSTLAVFLVLGGGAAFAAGGLGPDSVGTKQLKNGAVTGAKIKDGTVTGSNLDLASLGTVPAATHADAAGHADSASTAQFATAAQSATTAQSAATATSAQSAANAGELGGAPPSSYQDHCPAQTRAVGAALCLEEIGGLRTFNSATEVCSDEGLRLPSLGEAELLLRVTPAGGYFWVADFWVGAGGSEALVGVPFEGTLRAQGTNLDYIADCVTTPGD